MARYLLLGILWILWCTLHSALISGWVTDCLRQRFPGPFRFYRIFFNLVSLTTLLPVLLYSFSLRGPVLFSWQGPWRIVQGLVLLSAFAFFGAGARRYDLLQFLGLRQVRGENTCSALTDDCSLDTSGVLSMVRHPWYTGGILVVWARPLDAAALCTNLLISGYFIVGAWLEERKLETQFGEAYVQYQQRVSMFFPVKWATAWLLKKR